MKIINIPNDIVNLIKQLYSNSQCIKQKFYKTASKDQVDWLINNDVSLKLLYHTIVKLGLNYIEFKTCKVCGKPLSEPQLIANRIYCSTKCASHDPEKAERTKQTNLQKYGVQYVSQNQAIQQQRHETYVQKYGEDFGKLIYEKGNITREQRYGNQVIFNSAACLDSKQKYRNHFYESFVELLKQRHIILDMTKQEYLQASVFKYKCAHCGKTWKTTDHDVYHMKVCDCITETSSTGELELLNFIKDNYKGTIKTHDRSVLDGKELDIYLPDIKLAFEFDGIFWHSINQHHLDFDKKYHFTKSMKCKQKGVRLIHVFEYIWNNKQEQIKSIILNALNVYDHRVYARKCVVKSIDNSTYKGFLDSYHLQGSVNSTIRKGLFYNEQLIAVIGLGKSRFEKDILELHRFCVKPKYRIVGGFSKLLASVDFTDITSYIDISTFNGNGYFSVGFELQSITQPNYVYCKGNTIYTRYTCQKHKLSTLLQSNYDCNLTEQQNMLNNNYCQFFDCGNYKVKLIKK